MRRCFVPATRLSGAELWGFDRPRPLECPVYCQPGFPQCGHGWASSQTLAEGWAAPDHGGACRSNPGGSLVRDNGGSGIPRAAHLQVQHPTGAGYQEAQAWWEIWVVYRRNLDGSEPRYYLSQLKPVRSLSSHWFYSPLKEGRHSGGTVDGDGPCRLGSVSLQDHGDPASQGGRWWLYHCQGPAALPIQPLTPGKSTAGSETGCCNHFQERALTVRPKPVKACSEVSLIPSAPTRSSRRMKRVGATLTSWLWVTKRKTYIQASGARAEPSPSSSSATSSGGRVPGAATTPACMVQPATWAVPK